MGKILKSIDETIGNTPLVELTHFETKYKLKTKILGKLEYFNATGSIKDRIAKNMLDEAEKEGLINKDTIIIEPTSGNTGIGLASIGTSRGYKVIIIMPETMSKERIALIKAYGADIVLTDGSKGMAGAIEEAEKLHKQYENSYIPSQFENINNTLAHYKTTGPEIWDDTDGKVDIFISAVGTGGTITGTGKYLKEKNPNIKIIAVEPDGSPVLSKGIKGKHKIQGIGAGFVPKILDTSIYDEVITVTDEDAYQTAKEIGKTEGILIGISSGAAIYAAKVLSERNENENKNIVVILPDTGTRYLSTGLFD